MPKSRIYLYNSCLDKNHVRVRNCSFEFKFLSPHPFPKHYKQRTFVFFLACLRQTPRTTPPMTPQSVARVSHDPFRHDVTFSFVIFAIFASEEEESMSDGVVCPEGSERDWRIFFSYIDNSLVFKCHFLVMSYYHECKSTNVYAFMDLPLLFRGVFSSMLYYFSITLVSNT